MAGGADIRAGRAYVELLLKDEKFTKGLKTAQRGFRNFGSELQNIAGPMLRFSGALLAPFAGAVKAASDLEETMNKFNVVFGDSSKEVKAWGDGFADEVGRSKKQIADFMANTADLLIPLGFEAGAATDFSKQITGLSLDLASFNNMADEDVLRDLHAALTGSGEVMKKYGVIVSEAAVKQELLNQGIDPGKVTEQQKVQARMNIIMRGTTAAQGDAIRSGGGFANTLKRITGNVMDAAASLGTVLLPIVTQYAQQVANGIKEVAAFVQSHQNLILIVAKTAAAVFAVGAALAAAGLISTQVAAGIGALVSAFNALKVASLFLLANPAVLALVAIAAAAVAASVAIDKLTSYTAELSSVAGERLAAGDKQRAQDQAAIKRLQELADKQKLSNAEMAEAKSLADALAGQYGDLGITIDQTTGKISGLTNAQRELQAAMKEAAIAEVNANLMEMENNISELLKEAENAKGFWANTLFGSGGEDAINSALKKAQVERQKTYALQIRLAALRKGDQSAITGNPNADQGQEAAARSASELAKARTSAAEAAKQLAQIEEQEAAKRRTRFQQEIHDIEEVAAERERLIDLMIAGEKAREDGPRSSALSILEARKLAEKEEAENQIKAALAAQAKQEKQEKQAAEKRKADFERSQQDEIAQLEIETNPNLSEKEKQLAKLELERKRELSEAQEQGFDTKGIQRKFDLRRKALDIEATSSDGPQKIAGSFSAAAASALAGGGSPVVKKLDEVNKKLEEQRVLAERQARASEKTNDKLVTMGVLS